MGVEVAVRSYGQGTVVRLSGSVHEGVGEALVAGIEAAARDTRGDIRIEFNGLGFETRADARAFVVQLIRNLAHRQLSLVADHDGERRYLGGSADTMLPAVVDFIEGLETASGDRRWLTSDSRDRFYWPPAAG